MTAGEYAHREIQWQILRGELNPGQRLNQDELAETLGLSKIPVRSALEKLETEGLVVIERRKGASVATLKLDEIRELYLIRYRLEQLAVEMAFPRMDEDAVSNIEYWLTRSEAEAKRGVSFDYLEANRRFHLSLYAPCKMPTLLRMIEQLWNRILMYRGAYLRVETNIQKSLTAHRRLWELVQSRNSEAAKELIVQHNSETEEFLVGQLAQDKR